MAEAIFYYSIGLHVLVYSESIFSQIRTWVFMSNMGIVFILCGDICKTVEDSLVEWLDFKAGSTPEKSDTLTPNRFQALLHQAKSHGVGISGHIFMMDYTAVLSVSDDYEWCQFSNKNKGKFLISSLKILPFLKF